MNERIRIAYHPWEYILDELNARWRTQVKFAELLGITKFELNDIIKWKRNISPRLAIRIGIAFGVSPTTWLNLQNKYDIYLMETNKKEKAELSKVYERVFAFTSAMAVA